MVRFLGIDIPDNKKINIALTYIYGIGQSLSETLLKEAKIDFNKKAKDLTSAEFNALKELLDKKQIKTEGDLKREVRANVKRLINVSSYRGSRHIKRLPVRGQRTKTNSRTIRGNVRKTVGSGKRKAASPT
ncbi:MAG: 30S ribosomal protein S13 [Candidatus Pacebacteria bacterium]|nr:30S ribosomal protein S13 [Candidatus Paceibacterota bacterium]MDD5721695.1 30S ribosomal protein S13 [Candidatus Paceibacterota bacterium]